MQQVVYIMESADLLISSKKVVILLFMFDLAIMNKLNLTKQTTCNRGSNLKKLSSLVLTPANGNVLIIGLVALGDDNDESVLQLST